MCLYTNYKHFQWVVVGTMVYSPKRTVSQIGRSSKGLISGNQFVFEWFCWQRCQFLTKIIKSLQSLIHLTFHHSFRSAKQSPSSSSSWAELALISQFATGHQSARRSILMTVFDLFVLIKIIWEALKLKWKTTSFFFVNGRQLQFFANGEQPQFFCKWKMN